MPGISLPFRRDPDSKQDLVSVAMKPLRRLGRRLMLMSALINLTTLAVSVYMMQVYDRVLTSQSKDTLLFLTLAVVLVLAFGAILDGVRQLAASRASTWMATAVGPDLLRRAIEQREAPIASRLEALRELARVKNFLSSPTVFSLMDMCWVPLYVLVVFALHPLLGAICLVGAVVLLALAFYNERVTSEDIRVSQLQAAANQHFSDSLVRNSEAVDAMGMSDNVIARWRANQALEAEAGERSQGFSGKVLAVTKLVRNLVQIALLAAGALLVLDLQMTGGAMIAASILAARLLAPIEACIGFWKQFVLARAGLERLKLFCRMPQLRSGNTDLPAPQGAISVAGLTYVPPGTKVPVLKGVSFALEPGKLLAVVGPSASGKTTLARALVGLVKPASGHVRLDGADTFEWKRADFGRHVGYLPQDVELLPGTVRDNIARFDREASDAEVVGAAKLADCHELILQLGSGYDSVLTDSGFQLSGGQRQRIGLARALFGGPRLVVLDEPNASLDSRGDAALIATLTQLKALKITTVVVSHRNNLLQLADAILVMRDGRVSNFGPAAAVIEQLTNPAARRPSGTPTAAIVGKPAVLADAQGELT